MTAFEKTEAGYAKARQMFAPILNDDCAAADISVADAITLSESALGNYVTLDWRHVQEIDALLQAVDSYAKDETRNRPLNVMMQAGPGSGKSHFVKRLTEKSPVLTEENLVEFNMAALTDLSDMKKPIEEVRSIGVNPKKKKAKKVPLLFLDEFDSSPAYISFLLPLLWDGTAFLGGSDLDLGKVVIVLAGSGAAVDRLMTLAQQMRADLFQEEGKLVDLLSRINGGVIRVPDLDRVERGRNRKVDKVCITIALLRGRFGSQLKQVPWSLLHFVAVSRFRYGVRSIAHFVDTIPVGAYTAPDLALAPNSLDLEDEARLRKSSLVYHLVSDEGGYEIVNNWKEANSCKASVVIA